MGKDFGTSGSPGGDAADQSDGDGVAGDAVDVVRQPDDEEEDAADAGVAGVDGHRPEYGRIQSSAAVAESEHRGLQQWGRYSMRCCGQGLMGRAYCGAVSLRPYRGWRSCTRREQQSPFFLFLNRSVGGEGCRRNMPCPCSHLSSGDLPSRLSSLVRCRATKRRE